jgi:stage 0 sporulation protein B (sporulation initiation phosphotransferase)
VESKDIIQLLRLQRHDLMNDLQIVHGYLSMGKVDKVKLKVNDLLEAYHQERLLMNLNCPNFALWIIQLNWKQPNMRFKYHIHSIKNDLSRFDDVLTLTGTTLIDILTTVVENQTEVVAGEIDINEKNSLVEMVITIDGQAINKNEFKVGINNKIDNVSISENNADETIVCTFTFPA